MTFWARFRYYLIGVSLGVVISFFFFRGRGCAWLPENRVKNELAESVVLYTDKMKCELKCNNLKEEDIYELFYSGEVLFSESKPNEDPKIYVLEGESAEGKTFKVAFKLKDTISTVDEIIDGTDDGACKCDREEDILKEMKMPEATAKKLIGDRPLEFNDLALCQLDCYDLSEEKAGSFISKGNFNVDASNRRKHPYPELFFEYEGYEMVIELTMETARVINIVKRDNPDCGCY
jgi:hypothetical protein